MLATATFLVCHNARLSRLATEIDISADETGGLSAEASCRTGMAQKRKPEMSPAAV
jgi:hypothetical protein